MIQKKSSLKICIISSVFILLIVFSSVIFVSGLGTTLLCLEKGQTAKFSLCNPTMDDKLCSCTSKTCICQLCTNEISTGVYCPASPNACNVGSLECTYLPLDNSTNQTNNTVIPINVTLVNPADNTSTQNTGVIFKYSATNPSNITNCSVYANNNLIATNSSKITALTNIITKTLAPGNYNWFIRCIAKNGNSYDSAHRFITITGSNPNNQTNNSINITLTSPEDNSSGNNTEILFVYSVSDKTNLTTCNLNVNGDILISSTITSLQNNFSANLSVGNYTWNVDCMDKSGKDWLSQTRTLIIQDSTIVVPPVNPGNGGGGGGGGGSSGGGTVILCNTLWNCTEWSTCTNATQKRVCSYNTNKCKPTASKPIELQSCTLQIEQNNESTTNQNTTKQPNAFNNLLTGASVALKNKPLTIAIPIIVIVICVIIIIIISATGRRKNKDKTKTTEKEEDKTEKDKEPKKEAKKEKKESK
jgi:hypothetical protein